MVRWGPAGPLRSVGRAHSQALHTCISTVQWGGGSRPLQPLVRGGMAVWMCVGAVYG